MNISGHIRELDLGVIPSPSGAGALLLHDEGKADCYLVIMTHNPTTRATDAALVTAVGCSQSICGYPNDEAYSRDPRPGDQLSYGFFEVEQSTWDSELNAYNRHAFPDTQPRSALRHFFVGCHDSSVQFLARDIKVEIFDAQSHTRNGGQVLGDPEAYGKALVEALRRLQIQVPTATRDDL